MNSCESERFELQVSEYLNKNGLFTLSPEDREEKDLGKVNVYIAMESINGGEIYSRKFYSVDNPVGLIDDNSLTPDKDDNYMLRNQGKDYGYSTENEIVFFPNQLKQGAFNFQVIVEMISGERIYSNIIKVDLPLIDI